MAKKTTNDKEPVSGLTVNQLMSINQGIDLVGTLQFPMKISYQLGKIKGQLESRVKSHDKAINALRERLRVKKDGQWIIPDKNVEQWRNESDDLLDAVDNDLKLRTFKFDDFDFQDDEYYKDTKVSQQFITFMMPLLTD